MKSPAGRTPAVSNIEAHRYGKGDSGSREHYPLRDDLSVERLLNGERGVKTALDPDEGAYWHGADGGHH
jgi:hypothetical protein